MHPFGGTQICPRCSKAVYAAEQVMGPGRKLFHKPCLSCMNCKRRLDSYTLLEHDEMPYCKPCHLKLFGTRDLRHANHPYRPHTPDSNPSTSPPREYSPARSMSNDNALPKLKANRSLSPTSTSFPSSSFGSLPTDESEQSVDGEVTMEQPETIQEEEGDKVPDFSPSSSHTGTEPPPISASFSSPLRRTTPLSPTRNNSNSLPPSSFARPGHKSNQSLPANGTNGGANANGNGNGLSAEAPMIKPLMQTATGTRYGNALSGGVGVQLTGSGGSPRRWMAQSNPTCPRCNKSVYFAEQAKAVGKTFHKGCLRCVECNTLLDSSRLREHDGDPICMRCYGKVHGPQGAGYALLGKAGG